MASVSEISRRITRTATTPAIPSVYHFSCRVLSHHDRRFNNTARVRSMRLGPATLLPVVGCSVCDAKLVVELKSSRSTILGQRCLWH